MMALHIANGFHMSSYAAFAIIADRENFSFDLQNLSAFSDGDNQDFDNDYLTNLPIVKAIFYAVYISIFAVGICGNVLVCYVVFRNKCMQSVTNLFITNLALSDILLCTFAVPFTPLYIFISEWVFGQILCHFVPYAQGVSVYISAFTLTAIAIDRFFVIIYPFRPRLPLQYCYGIIVFIWIAAGLLTLPYGIFMNLAPHRNGLYCDEAWPDEPTRMAFGFSTSVLQFVIPFFIITFCYLQVCNKLTNRARCKPGAKSAKKDEMERERTKRTNRMLITMVVIFGVSWLPINIYNLIIDFYIPASTWSFVNVMFFTAHATAMSSTCYNPFLYAWLNENFRKEFMMVLPCFGNSRSLVQNATKRKQGLKNITSQNCSQNVSKRETAVEVGLPLRTFPNQKDKHLQRDRIAAVSTTETFCANVTTSVTEKPKEDENSPSALI